MILSCFEEFNTKEAKEAVGFGEEIGFNMWRMLIESPVLIDLSCGDHIMDLSANLMASWAE